MAKITNKIVISKYQPKSTNVIWIDISGDKPVEKHFINGRWMAISSSNSGSVNPGYTVTKSYPTYFYEQDILTVFYPLDNLALSDDILIEEGLKRNQLYKVIFNGTEYYVTSLEYVDNEFCLGEVDGNNDPVFDNYPFWIGAYYQELLDSYVMYMITPDDGTYSLEIEEVTKEVTITPEFEAAVSEAVSNNPSGQGGGGASFESLDSIPKIQFTQDIPQESFWDKIGKVTGLEGSFPLSLNAIDAEGDTGYNMVMYLLQVEEYTTLYSTVIGTYCTFGQSFAFYIVFSNEDKTEGYVYRN